MDARLSSASTKPQSRKKITKVEIVGDLKDGLRDVTKKLFILYCPWTSWSVSGPWIVGDPDIPAVGKITETDDAGREILSYVPLSLIKDFLSASGQTFVSHSELHYIFSVLINNLDDPPDQHFDDVHPIVSCKSPSEQRLHDLWPRLQTDLVPFEVRQRIRQRASDASGSKIDPGR